MSLLPFLVLIFSLIFVSALHLSHQTALLAPITKDHTTHQYTIQAHLKTPLQPTKLLLHLGASFSWLDCYQNYTSSTFSHVPCNSSLCSSLRSLACANSTCALFPENPLTRRATLANALLDSLALPTTDGSTQLSQLGGLVPDFLFSCSQTSLLQGLAKGVAGLAALGRSNFSIPAQVSRSLSLPRSFALCLSGSRSQPGPVFLGSGGPYFFNSKIDLSNTVITYYLQPSDEYFIGLTSIRVNGKAVPINASLLTVDENGFGGTKISTVDPYTVLETSIYKAFADLFVKEALGLNLTVTATAVNPFGVCYAGKDIMSTRVGPAVPTVDLVMQSDDVFWRVFGSNSMVRIERSDADVWCLGFVDGGPHARTSVVIGGHQLEDNLLQFDLESKRLGFSSSILVRGTTCANFNFTSSSSRHIVK
ncbi:hypothetical protein ACB092_10G095800 [Castanea dentata]